MPKLQLEDDAYLDRVVSCNRALGVCLDQGISDVKSLEAAQRKLKHGEWTTNAASLAVAYSSAFPWLPEVIASGKGQRCPVWEQLAADLAGSDKYNEWVYRRTRRYLQQVLRPPPSQQQDAPKESVREQARMELAWILTRMFYVLCSGAGHYQARIHSERAQGNATKSWLDSALYERNAEPGRELREWLGQKKRLEGASTAESNPADPLNATPRRVTIRTDTDVFGAGGDATRPPDPATDADETPGAIVQTEERDARIQQATADLPAEQQRVLQHRIWEGLSWEDTAATMGLSLPRTKTLFKNAKNRLRATLAGV